MPRQERSPYYRETSTFTCDGIAQFLRVLDGVQTIQRCLKRGAKVLEEITLRISPYGGAIEQIGLSPSGQWLTTMRYSGQGEWGYDIIRTQPLERLGGLVDEHGYNLELPVFDGDETRALVAGGPGYLGGWWAHPEDDIDVPARAGKRTLGYLYVHDLTKNKIKRHALQVRVPRGWLPDDPWASWYGPRAMAFTPTGIRMVPSWGGVIEVAAPLPKVILLPVPHPSGRGTLGA